MKKRICQKQNYFLLALPPLSELSLVHANLSCDLNKAAESGYVNPLWISQKVSSQTSNLGHTLHELSEFCLEL